MFSDCTFFFSPVGLPLFSLQDEGRGANMSMAQISNKSAESNGFGGATKSTAARGCFIYEGDRAVNEYLQFHYGR